MSCGPTRTTTCEGISLTCHANMQIEPLDEIRDDFSSSFLPTARRAAPAFASYSLHPTSVIVSVCRRTEPEHVLFTVLRKRIRSRSASVAHASREAGPDVAAATVLPLSRDRTTFLYFLSHSQPNTSSAFWRLRATYSARSAATTASRSCICSSIWHHFRFFRGLFLLGLQTLPLLGRQALRLLDIL